MSIKDKPLKKRHSDTRITIDVYTMIYYLI